jgi:hypothetical protein
LENTALPRDYCAQSPRKINRLQSNSLRSGTGNFKTSCRENFSTNREKIVLEQFPRGFRRSEVRRQHHNVSMCETPQAWHSKTASSGNPSNRETRLASCMGCAQLGQRGGVAAELGIF